MCHFVPLVSLDVAFVPLVPIVSLVPLVPLDVPLVPLVPLDVVSSLSSVAILVQVFDSAEFLLRVAVERLGLDTAEFSQAWRNRSRFHSTGHHCIRHGWFLQMHSDNWKRYWLILERAPLG